MNEGRLPLGIFKQAMMKLDSFHSDMYEIIEDEDINDEERKQCEVMAEIAYTMMSNISYIVSTEIDPDEFYDLKVEMDPFEHIEEE